MSVHVQSVLVPSVLPEDQYFLLFHAHSSRITLPTLLPEKDTHTET